MWSSCGGAAAGSSINCAFIRRSTRKVLSVRVAVTVVINSCLLLIGSLKHVLHCCSIAAAVLILYIYEKPQISAR